MMSQHYLLGAALTRETVTTDIDGEEVTVQNALILRVALTDKFSVMIHDYLMQDAYVPFGPVGGMSYPAYRKTLREFTVCSGSYAGFQRVNFSRSGQKAVVTVFPHVDLPTRGWYASRIDTDPIGAPRVYIRPLSRQYRTAGIAHYLVDGVAVSTHTAPMSIQRDVFRFSEADSSQPFYLPVDASYPAFVDFSDDEHETTLVATVVHGAVGDFLESKLVFPDATSVPIAGQYSYRTRFATAFLYLDIRKPDTVCYVRHRLAHSVPYDTEGSPRYNLIDVFRGGALVYARATVVAYDYGAYWRVSPIGAGDTTAQSTALAVTTPTRLGTYSSFASSNGNRPTFWTHDNFSSPVDKVDLYGVAGGTRFLDPHAVCLMPCPPDPPIGWLDHTLSDQAYCDFCFHFAPVMWGFNGARGNGDSRISPIPYWNFVLDIEFEYAECGDDWVLSARVGLCGVDDGARYARDVLGVDSGDPVTLYVDIDPSNPPHVFETVEYAYQLEEPTRILLSSLDIPTLLGDSEIDEVIPLGVI